MCGECLEVCGECLEVCGECLEVCGECLEVCGEWLDQLVCKFISLNFIVSRNPSYHRGYQCIFILLEGLNKKL